MATEMAALLEARPPAGATAWTSRAGRSMPGCTRRPGRGSRRSRRLGGGSGPPWPPASSSSRPRPTGLATCGGRARPSRSQSSSWRSRSSVRALGGWRRAGRPVPSRSGRRRPSRLDRGARGDSLGWADGPGTAAAQTDRSGHRRSSGSAACRVARGDDGRRRSSPRAASRCSSRGRRAGSASGMAGRLSGPAVDRARTDATVPTAGRYTVTRASAAGRSAAEAGLGHRRGVEQSVQLGRRPSRARGRARGSCARS